MTSKIARNFQRQAGAQEVERGWLSDPLRLPYAQILQGVNRIRVSDAYRRMVTLAAAIFAGQLKLFDDARLGLSDDDFLILDRAFDQLLLDMDARPYLDILGPVYMEIAHKLDRGARGEFYTPHSVSRLLARMAIGPDAHANFQPGQIWECNEPAAGTGGMVLAFAEALIHEGINPMHTRWVIQDISPLSCYGAYLNTSLWSIPATIVCGDTLRLTANWSWQNMYWHAAHPLIPTAEDLAREQELLMRVEGMRAFITGLPKTFQGTEEPA